jgi:hypothetical protein
MRETPIERVRCQNTKDWILKRNVSSQITRAIESNTLNKGAYVQVSDQIENLQ